MIIEEIMKSNVETLRPDDSIETAIRLMREKKIKHIPIVDDEMKVLGIISDRDVKDAAPSILNEQSADFTLKNPVRQIMQQQVITGHPLDFVEEVAALFYEHRISCLPILKADKLVGIITETDLLYTLTQLTGANQPGSQIEVKVPHRAGILYEVAGIIRKYNANILSVLVYPDKQDEQQKVLVFRVQTMNPTRVIEEIKSEGYSVLWPNMPGMPS